MEFDLKKIKMPGVMVIFSIVFGVLIPGYLIFYMFDRKAFLEMDAFRVSVISISISTPFFFLNFFSISNSRNHFENHKDENISHTLNTTIIVSSIMSSVIIYIVIFLKYFFNISIGFAVLSIALWEIYMLFRWLLAFKKIGEEKKTS